MCSWAHCLQGSEMQQSSHARSMLNTLSMAQMPTLMGVRKEEQQPVSSKPLAAAATMLAGAMRGMPLLPARSAALPSMRMGPMQVSDRDPDHGLRRKRGRHLMPVF